MRATNAKAMDFFVAFAKRSIELPRVPDAGPPVNSLLRLWSGRAPFAAAAHGCVASAASTRSRHAAATSPLRAACEWQNLTAAVPQIVCV